MTIIDNMMDQVKELERQRDCLGVLLNKRGLEQAYIQSYQLTSIPIVKDQWFQSFMLLRNSNHGFGEAALARTELSKSLLSDPLSTLFPDIHKPRFDKDSNNEAALYHLCQYFEEICESCPDSVKQGFADRGTLIISRIEKIKSKIGGIERKRRESFSSRKRTMSATACDNLLLEETREIDAMEIRINKKRDELQEHQRAFQKFKQSMTVMAEKRKAQEVKTRVLEKQRALMEAQKRKSRLSLMDSLIHSNSPSKIPKRSTLSHQSQMTTNCLNELVHEWTKTLDQFTSFQDQSNELANLKGKVHALLTRLSQKDQELSKFINQDTHKFSKILLFPFDNQVKTVKESAFKQEISKSYEEEDTASHIFYVSMVRRLIAVDRVKGTITFNYYP